MSNLEHLVENGIFLMEKSNVTHSEWVEIMKSDCNWKHYTASITIDDLWEICQYVVYVYKSHILLKASEEE